MTIDAPCPQCGTIFTVRRELLGKRTKCIRCGAAFTIAERATAPTPPPPPSPPAVHDFPEMPPPPEITPLPTVTPEPMSRPTKPSELFGFEADASQPRFPALRIVARAYEVLAVVVLAFGAVALMMFVNAVVVNRSAILAALLGSGLTFFWCTVVAMSLLAGAQIIRLALQVEQNTRQTHQACRQLADHLCAIETER
jgi:hypothetical protein